MFLTRWRGILLQIYWLKDWLQNTFGINNISKNSEFLLLKRNRTSITTSNYSPEWATGGKVIIALYYRDQSRLYIRLEKLIRLSYMC